MQTSFPLKLEIVSLELSDKLDNDLRLEISLNKGMQRYGEIRFQIEKNFSEYFFDTFKVIHFMYTPRLQSRKDIFFHLALADLEDGHQLGDIPISTHMLAEKFEGENLKSLDLMEEVFEGAFLTFRISKPEVALLETNHMNHSLVNKSSYLERQEPSDEIRVSTIRQPDIKKSSIMDLINQSIETATQEAQPVNLIGSLFNKGRVVDEKSEYEIVEPHEAKKQPKSQQISREQTGGIFLSKMFKLVKQSHNEQQRKRFTLASSKQGDHHAVHHHLSFKLKMVIFLVVFGLLMMFVEFIQDKQQIAQSVKKKKPVKSKVRV